jgi:hypothetical protein
MPYKGPGFYNELGERVCSFHPQSMTEYLSNLGFKMVEDMDDFDSEEAEEQQRRDEKNELYGPRKEYQLKWGGTD